MEIKNLKESDIVVNNKISSNFFTITSKNINLDCKIYKGDFYLDSFNYCPITKENYTFLHLFHWRDISDYNHIFTKEFNLNFQKNKKNFTVFENVVVLGSSPGNDYYRNLLTFIPRLFFITEKKINLAIHRQTSNKVREFLKNILKARGIEIKKFVYLDDNFYFFKNSTILQFFTKRIGMKILNKIFYNKIKKNMRIYITRKNAHYRKIINESDIIDELKLKNFKIIDLDNMSIDNQIDIFSSSEIIVSPASSGLANIVFCKAGTKVYEIIPKYKHRYENEFKRRYFKICQILGFKYYTIPSDPVPVDGIDKLTKTFIDSNIIKESNYYKNLIVQKSEFKKLLNQF